MRRIQREGRCAGFPRVGEQQQELPGQFVPERSGGASAVVGQGGRHADVDDGQIRAVRSDCVGQLLRITDSGDDVVAGVGQ